MDNFFPNNEQINKLADKVRNGMISKILEGKDLLNPSLENKLLLDNQRDIVDIDSIDSETDEIWTRLTMSQKSRLIKLANNLNKNRNFYVINSIYRLNVPQIANTTLGNLFYNGTKSFNDDQSFESLILPLGHGGAFQ
jgi:hypothetical protein